MVDTLRKAEPRDRSYLNPVTLLIQSFKVGLNPNLVLCERRHVLIVISGLVGYSVTCSQKHSY